jgi:Sterile alpha motif (SAM)/Pointed domain
LPYCMQVTYLLLVFTDPRQWSREDVQLWLRQMSVDYDDVIATPDYTITDRFPMNGRGLCLMARKPEMFETRVPCGGLLLFNDFRSRLLRAVTSSIGDTRTMAAPTVA